MPANTPKPIMAKTSSARTFLHIFWLRKWILLLIWFIIAVPSGLLLSLFDLPRSYTVSTLLRFPYVKGAQISMMRDMAITQKESILTLLKSYQVLQATVDKLQLRVRLVTPELFRKDIFTDIVLDKGLTPDSYSFSFSGNNLVIVSLKYSNGYSESFKAPLKGNHLEIPGLKLEFVPDFIRNKPWRKFGLVIKSENSAIKSLGKSLKIKSLGTVNYEISLKDRDPWLVAKILNTLRQEFLSVYYGTTEVQDVNVLVQMENNLELAKDRLNKSQNELDKFYRNHPSLLRKDEPVDETKSMAYLNLQSEKIQMQERFRKVVNIYNAKPVETSVDEMLFWAREILSAMYQAGVAKAGIQSNKLISLQQKKTKFQSEFGPGHPKIVGVENELALIFQEIEHNYSQFENNYQRQQRELAKKIIRSKPYRRARPSVKVELELDRLMAQNLNNEKAYSKLLASYNQAKLTTGSEFFKVNVVDKARPAVYKPPSLSQRLIVAGSAVALLFLLLSAFLVVWQIIFPRIWTMDDIKKFLGIKPLGYTVENMLARRMRRHRMGKTEKADPMLIFSGEGHTLQDIECYRSLRESCFHFFAGGQNKCMTILITSTRPGDGKSTFTANLGISIARTGHEVLIIDGELRLGTIHKLFNVKPESGLTELLSKDVNDEDAFSRELEGLILPTNQKNLFFLPRGKADIAAGELAGTEKFRYLLEAAKKKFKIVLVDTPPLLVAADGLSIIPEVDGVAFVCFSGSTIASEAMEPITAIRERTVKVGAVLNGVQVTPFKYFQYSKYGYYYRASQLASSEDESRASKNAQKQPKPSRLERKLLFQRRKAEKKQAQEEKKTASVKSVEKPKYIKQEISDRNPDLNNSEADFYREDTSIKAVKPAGQKENSSIPSNKDLDDRFDSLRI